MKALGVGGGAGAAAVTMVAAVTAGILALLTGLGVAPWAPRVPEGAKATITSQQVQEIDTSLAPASRFIDSLVVLLNEEWEGRDRVDRAQPPFPLSCTQEPGPTPVDSVSMTVTRGGRMQATVAVYPAGQGAPTLDYQLQHSSSCATGSTTTWHTEVSGPGAQAAQVHTTWNGKSTIAHVWRQGDVVAYLVAAAGTPLSEAASAMDTLLLRALDGRCVDPDSTAEDAVRSPLAAGYEPYSKKVRVRVKAAEAPAVPADLDLNDPAVPMPEVSLDQVHVPSVPAYPVWPPLPDPVPEPTAPEAPAEQDTARTITSLLKDADGPGCGWAFTGQLAPPFDAAAAAEQLETDRTSALVGLQVGQSQWARAVLDYWSQWPAYLKQVEAYRDYTERVREVSAAWDEIAEQWRLYEAEQSQFEADMRSYEQAVADRELAQEEFEAQVAACTPPEIDEEAEGEDPSRQEADLSEAESSAADQPGGSPAPDGEELEEEELEETAQQEEDSAEETVQPQEPAWSAPEFCPAQPASVLDEPEPVAPTAPTPPADPRPQDSRG